MGIETALWAGVAAAAAGAANQAYQGKRQRDSASAAQQRQQEALDKAEAQQEQDFNRQNQRTADVGALLQQNTGVGGGANLTAGSAGQGVLGYGGMLGR